jgi:DNA modification methylase
VTPYYADAWVTLWHGDCLSLADRWVDHSDVLLTDPPYGIDYRSGQKGSLPRSIAGDADTSVRDAALTLWTPGPALAFGTWRRPRPTGTHTRLIWDTGGALGMGDLRVPWKPADQEIYVIGGGFSGPRTNNVLRYPPAQSMAKNGRLHPHEKPVELLRDLVRKCPPGVIADPFAGSGSTLVAARLEGRRAIGVELDEAYCELIAQRLSRGDAAVKQQATEEQLEIA